MRSSVLKWYESSIKLNHRAIFHNKNCMIFTKYHSFKGKPKCAQMYRILLVQFSVKGST